MFTNSQIDATELPKVEAQSMQPIHPNYLFIIYINTVLSFSIAIGALIFTKIFSGDPSFSAFANYIISALIVGFIVSISLATLGFKKRKYAMREHDITYSHGYIVTKTVTLPYNRIQHIEITRSFLARKLGVSTLKIYSAGESGGDLSIKGLPKDIAASQYAFLTKVINERL